MHTASRLTVTTALAVVFTLMVAAAALAADLVTSADLSTDADLPTEVSVGDNSFTIRIWATGNLPAGRPGTFTVVTKYFMDADGNVSPSSDAADEATETFGDNYNYSQCPASNPPRGCADNPFEFPATLVVAPGTPHGTTGTLVVSHEGSQSLDDDETPAQGFVTVVSEDLTYSLEGFYAPVRFETDITAKGGQTIPLKFNLLDANGDLVVDEADKIDLSFTACPNDSSTGGDTVVATTSEPASREVRWDEDAQQYIYNWKTPKGPACRTVEVTHDDATVDQFGLTVNLRK